MIINDKQLLIDLDNDWVLVKELIEICIQKLPEYLQNIVDAVATNNDEKLELHAHTMKGSVACFGYHPLTEACYNLEVAAREKKSGEFKRMLEVVKKEFSVFYSDLEILAKKAHKQVA